MKITSDCGFLEAVRQWLTTGDMISDQLGRSKMFPHLVLEKDSYISSALV